MKTRYKSIPVRSAFAVAICIASIFLSGQSHAASATAAGTATVILPMTITKTTDLRFGIFAPTAAAGTVVVTPAGVRTGTGVSLVNSTGTSGAATFSITGDTTYTFAITLPTTTTLTSGANTMSLGTFTSNPSATGTLVAGAATLAVGGTLTVAASQAAGAYTGNFSVTVDYN